MKRSLILLTVGAVFAVSQVSAMHRKGKRRSKKVRHTIRPRRTSRVSVGDNTQEMRAFVRVERGPNQARRSLSSHLSSHRRSAAAGRDLRYVECKAELDARQHKLGQDENEFRREAVWLAQEEQAIKAREREMASWHVGPRVYTAEDLRRLSAQGAQAIELERQSAALTEREILQELEATRLLRQRSDLAVAKSLVLMVKGQVLIKGRAELDAARARFAAEYSDC